eukprot:scaffold15191_cov65-Phaeocystis_antarctica.AAC.4
MYTLRCSTSHTLGGLSVIVPRRALRRRNIDHARTDQGRTCRHSPPSWSHSATRARTQPHTKHTRTSRHAPYSCLCQPGAERPKALSQAATHAAPPSIGPSIYESRLALPQPTSKLEPVRDKVVAAKISELRSSAWRAWPR